MAKDLPYFKFFCSEWSDGDITLESYEAQGLFINVCSYYWSKECDVTFDKLLKRFKGHEDLDVLFAEKLIKREDDNIRISFLDEQQSERQERSKIRSKGGLASAEARRLKKLEQESNTTSTENEHVLNSCSTQSQLLREEKRREEKKRKESVFNSWWDLYDNKKGLSKSKAKFLKLSDAEIQAILKITPIYVKSTPDVKYRKLPLTWLNGEHWNDDFTTKAKKFINPCF